MNYNFNMPNKRLCKSNKIPTLTRLHIEQLLCDGARPVLRRGVDNDVERARAKGGRVLVAVEHDGGDVQLQGEGLELEELEREFGLIMHQKAR